MHPFAYEMMVQGDIKCLPVPLHSDYTYTQKPIIFPGSFNPIHERHLLMAETAAKYVGEEGNLEVWFEISIENADKGIIPQPDLQLRIYDLWGHRDKPFVGGLVITKSPNFIDKMKVMKVDNAFFVVGSDTFVRIGEQHYYSNDYQRDAVMDFLAEHVEFLVFPRPDVDIRGSSSYRRLNSKFFAECTKFDDVSSTDIRNEASNE